MTKYRLICGGYTEYIMAKTKLQALQKFTTIYGELHSPMRIEIVEEK